MRAEPAKDASGAAASLQLRKAAASGARSRYRSVSRTGREPRACEGGQRHPAPQGRDGRQRGDGQKRPGSRRGAPRWGGEAGALAAAGRGRRGGRGRRAELGQEGP